MSSSAATRSRIDEAFALEEAGDIGAAIDLLTQAIEHAPGDRYPLACRGLRGCALATNGHARAAIADLVRSTEILPDQADAHQELGVLFERYRRAFDLEPDAYPGAPARIAELARQLPS